MKKCKIREKSPAYYALKFRKPLAIGLIAACSFGMVGMTEKVDITKVEMSPINVAYAESETKVVDYEIYKRIAYYGGNDEFFTEDSDLFYADGTDYKKGDCVVLTINDSGTSDMDDDYVISTKLKNEYYDVPLSHDMQDYIREVCAEYPAEINEVSLELVLAVIQQETNFDASAVGDNCDSYGLMQIQPKWHADRMEKLGVTDLFDPRQNVRVGIDYLAELLQKYTLDGALTAYNAGECGAEKLYFSKGETTSPYASSVLTHWREICLQECNE